MQPVLGAFAPIRACNHKFVSNVAGRSKRATIRIRCISHSRTRVQRLMEAIELDRTSRRQLWELQRQVDDLAADIVRDAIPDAVRSSAMVGQRFRPAVTIAIIPSVKGGAGNTELVQRALGRQV